MSAGKGSVRRGTNANPVVKVSATGADSYQAVCFTGTCDWSYSGTPKVAIDEQARWHRQAHRSGRAG